MATIFEPDSMAATVPMAARTVPAMQPLRGASLFQTKTHVDSRGELTAFDISSNLGFALKRVFFIRVEHANTIRAEHACSAEQVLIVLTGAVTIDIENGRERCSVRLVQGRSALWLSSGVWLRLRNFSTGTVLLVAASANYADTLYFDRPQPELISAN
jgi:WxcM-like, C-terminal